MIRFEHHRDVTYIRMSRSVCGRPVYWTGAYFSDGLLIDCGPPALARDLAKALAHVPLVGLILTHHHEDHSGGAALLSQGRGLVPEIHAEGVELLAGGLASPLYRRVAWGKLGPVATHPLGTEVAWRGGRLEVIHTPGHSPDHVCFFEPSRGWLFTGDLFLAERLRYLRDDEDLADLISSLRRVSALPLREVFCAHRGPVRDGPAALRRKVEHLEALQGRIQDLLREGVSEAEITRRVVGREGLLTWISRGDFAARNFVRVVARSDRPS